MGRNVCGITSNQGVFIGWLGTKFEFLEIVLNFL
jgi:hypothetical protein